MPRLRFPSPGPSPVPLVPGANCLWPGRVQEAINQGFPLTSILLSSPSSFYNSNEKKKSMGEDTKSNDSKIIVLYNRDHFFIRI